MIDPTRKHPLPVSKSRSFEKKLAAYALAGGAALAVATPAQATTVGCVPGFSASSGDAVNGCALDLDGDAVADFTLEAFLDGNWLGSGEAVHGVRVLSDNPNNTFVGVNLGNLYDLKGPGDGGVRGDIPYPSINFAIPLKPSMTIPDAIAEAPYNVWKQTPGYLKVAPAGYANEAKGAWNPNVLDGPPHLGFLFDVSGNPHFGWAHVGVQTLDDSSSFTLYNWGWDQGADSVHIPQVPEPSTLTMFALGAAGLLALKRRRDNKNKKAS